MENEGTMTQQSGFSTGTGGNSDVSPSATNTDTATASGADASTNERSASEGGGGSIPPATATPGADKNELAASENGSFKLVYNPRTGRNEVVSTMPKEQEQQPAEQPQVQKETPAQPETKPQTQQPAEYKGNELLQFMQLAQQQQHPVNPYSYVAPLVPQPQIAPQVQQPAPQQTVGQQPTEQDEVAAAKEYYANVNRMAQERAMQEIGITKDELDVAEYSDDQELLDKVAAYKTAIENNRTRIMRDVESIRQAQEAERADHANAYQAIVAFANEMRQKEPNFDAIDKLMTSRVAQMPYEKAARGVPYLQRLANGQTTMADLPVLQEIYNDTRLEFYSKREGVGLAPQVQKPAFVETPGSGGEAPRQTTPLSALGKMSKREREAAIGQMFRNFLDD